MQTNIITVIFTLVVAFSYAQDLSEMVNNFGIELLYFTHQDTEHSVALSPFGIWSLMTGVTLGTTGVSREQLVWTLRLPNIDNSTISAYKNLRNALLQTGMIQSRKYMISDPNITFLKDFEDNITADFASQLLRLDFGMSKSAALVANRVVLDSGVNTSNLLNRDDFSNSKVILTNIIVFRGFWKSPFNINRTRLQAFYSETINGTHYVYMMRQTGHFLYSEIDALQSQVLELPYTQKFSMIVILPYNNKSLSDVIRSFERITFRDVIRKLEMGEKKRVQISLPRFKISSNLILNRPLNKMGVYDIFEKERASFKKASLNDLHISKIVHKVDIEVTESDTVEDIERNDRLNATETFVANRNFLYFIIENTTKTVVVGGIYSKPK